MRQLPPITQFLQTWYQLLVVAMAVAMAQQQLYVRMTCIVILFAVGWLFFVWHFAMFPDLASTPNLRHSAETNEAHELGKLLDRRRAEVKQLEARAENAKKRFERLEKELLELEVTFQLVKDRQPWRDTNSSIDGGKQLQDSEEAHVPEQPTIDAPKETKRIDNSVAALGSDTILLIMASNRPSYLKDCLELVIAYHPLISVPIVVSEDGQSPQVAAVIKDAQNALRARSGASTLKINHVHHPPYVENFKGLKDYKTVLKGYFRLSKHFKWALSHTYAGTLPLQTPLEAAKRVIILEEDLLIAPDFFNLFAALRPFVDDDPKILAASAWNDNGFEGMVKDPAQLLRSDFFPGLGWMLSRRIWQELEPKWPVAFWDDWLRDDKQRKGRHSIHPEICRTFHIGTKGTSKAQYNALIKRIHLNNQAVDFTQQDLGYLEAERWHKEYLDEVRKARALSIAEFFGAPTSALERFGHGVRIQYTSVLEKEKKIPTSFFAIAKRLGAMDNVKAQVPRSAYNGIVSIWKNDVKVYLVPKSFN